MAKSLIFRAVWRPAPHGSGRVLRLKGLFVARLFAGSSGQMLIAQRSCAKELRRQSQFFTPTIRRDQVRIKEEISIDLAMIPRAAILRWGKHTNKSCGRYLEGYALKPHGCEGGRS